MYALRLMQNKTFIVLCQIKIAQMKKISISTQKGGVGKTTISIILANRLCFQYGLSVLLIDCDPPQSSLISNKNTEQKLLKIIWQKKKNNESLEEFEKTWAKEFERTASGHGKIDVISIDDPHINWDFKKIDHLATSYDIAIYDFPGTLEDTRFLHEMIKFDQIFVPVEPDCKAGAKSTATAAGLYILKQKFRNLPEMNLQEVCLFFNKVNPRSKQHLYSMLQLFKTAASKGFFFLLRPDGAPCFIDYRVIYQNDLSSSIMVDTSKFLRYTKLEAVIQTMIKKIGYGEKEN